MKLFIFCFLFSTCLTLFTFVNTNSIGNSTDTIITNTNNATTNNTLSTVQMIIDISLTLIPVLCYGSNYVPVKKFDTGDGLFFQWVLCAAVLIVGFVTYSVQVFPKFYALACVGGALWAIGNACVVIIVKMIGLSLGLMIWAVAALVVGWSSGAFGLFGIEKSVLPIAWLNYVGVVVCVIGAVVITFVKPNLEDKIKTQSPVKSYSCNEDEPFIADSYEEKEKSKLKIVSGSKQETKNILDRLNSAPTLIKKFIGIGLSLFSGLLYGVMFVPINVMLTRAKSDCYYSSQGLDYAFPYTVGTFLMASLILVIYCALSLNKPYINTNTILPGLLSGAIWAIGTMTWIYLNGVLSTTITFPIISSGPPIVGSIWGIIVFREIKGKWNLSLFVIALIILIIGIMCVTFSEFTL